MKQLLIIRHAKSSWDFIGMEDFDRPLNDRGEKDAPAMAKRLLKQDIDIDSFVSSPANRALSTARHFAKAYYLKEKKIIVVPDLYEASVATFYATVASFENNDKCVALFSHNPGVTDFANSLTSTQIDNLPTCGIFAVKADIKSWADFRDAEKTLWFFDYPKSEK